MSVVHVDSVDQYKELTATKDKLVVVDFTASWCGPCKKIAPVFTELAQKHTDALFLKVDVDELSTLPECSSIRGVPTFKFIKNGTQITEFAGANADKLATTVAANI